jgi:hypothetical protein
MEAATTPPQPPGYVDIATLREIYADNREAQAALDRIQAIAARLPVNNRPLLACAEFPCNNGRLVKFNVFAMTPKRASIEAQAGTAGFATAHFEIQGQPESGVEIG